MMFDLQARLSGQHVDPSGVDAWDFVGQIADECLAWSVRDANAARRRYMQQARDMASLALPSELRLDDLSEPPSPTWISIAVDFTLQSPWYSKDNRPFHVLDNPVRKDRVFGVPFMSATSWKGLLRWSFAMTTGLIGPAPIEGEKMRKQAKATILHLFGNEKGATEDFQRGSLAFYPTLFPRISFEVINPHSRARRAGTQPIYYEVVPHDTPGMLQLLYAPLPGDEGPTAVAISSLIDAIEALLVTYGFSAKRTVGWGTASIEKWTARRRDHQPIEQESAADFKAKVKAWLAPPEAGDE